MSHHCDLDIDSSKNMIQTINKVLNLCCDLELEHSEVIFSPDSQPYDDVPSKFGSKRISNSEDIIETVIFRF